MRFLLLVLFPVLVFAQDKIPDFNITGAGARAEGFGGAFIGLSDDATAVVWNPAGLSQLERPEASIVTRFIGETNSYKDNTNSSFNADESQSTFGLNFASLALPVKMNEITFVVAVAFQRQLDFAESRRRQFQFLDNSNNLITIDQKLETTGGVNTITPAVSMKLNPMVSVGLSANIWTGSHERDELLIGKSGAITLRDRFVTTANYSGFNLVFGGMIDLEAMESGAIPLKLGATFRTPFTLKADGSDDQTRESTPFNPKERFVVSQEVEMPVMLGFGASYRFGDNMTIAADFELRNFKGKKINNTASSPFSGTGKSSFSLTESDDNLNQFRIGGEYLIVADNGVIPLRAGFKNVPTVLANYTYEEKSEEEVPTNNQVRGTGISFGSGFISDAFAFDITLGITSYTQTYHPFGGIEYSVATIGSSVIFYF